MQISQFLSSSKKLLMFVNPFSGTKSAKSMCDNFGSPMLHEAGIDHEIVITGELKLLAHINLIV